MRRGDAWASSTGSAMGPCKLDFSCCWNASGSVVGNRFFSAIFGESKDLVKSLKF